MQSLGSEKIFAIGDIHGCADELQMLLERLPLGANTHIIFLGDYVDRGDNSKAVIDIILNLRNYYKITPLLGNHEAMLLNFLADSSSAEAGAFIYNGGGATLSSYANRNGQYHIPENHLDFLNSLALFAQTKDTFFVHAGVPDVPLNSIVPVLHKETLLWVREEFFNSKFKWNKVIVHGHTPVETVEFYPHRINVDTGCVFDQSLSAVELPGRIVHSVKKIKKSEHVFLRDEESKRIATRFEGQIPVVLQAGEKKWAMETINYSEFGMLLRPKVGGLAPLLKEGETILGEIKIVSDLPLNFQGTVIRKFERDGVVHYAVQFHRAIRGQ